MNKNLLGYYAGFYSNTLAAVLKDHIRDLEDVGSNVHPLSSARTKNLINRVVAIRSVLNSRTPTK